MKKFFCIVLCVSILGTSTAFSQEPLLSAREDRNPAVDVIDFGHGRARRYYWNAYYGTAQIRESEFFAIAGREDLARKAAGFRMSGQAFIGLAAILTFSAIYMANIEPASIREAEQTRATVSGAITAGMFSLVGGVALLFRRRFPIDTAREVADTYNAVLPSSK